MFGVAERDCCNLHRFSCFITCGFGEDVEFLQ
jgi:hypothetical protein